MATVNGKRFSGIPNFVFKREGQPTPCWAVQREDLDHFLSYPRTLHCERCRILRGAPEHWTLVSSYNSKLYCKINIRQDIGEACFQTSIIVTQISHRTANFIPWFLNTIDWFEWFSEFLLLAERKKVSYSSSLGHGSTCWGLTSAFLIAAFRSGWEAVGSGCCRGRYD